MEKEAFRDKLMERGALIALVTHAWNGHNRSVLHLNQYKVQAENPWGVL